MNYIPQDIQDMQEVYPPDYQKWLDEQEPSIEDREKHLLGEKNEPSTVPVF